MPTPVGRDRPFEISLHIDNRSGRQWLAEIRDQFPVACQPELWTTSVVLPAGKAASVACDVRIPIRGK
ncbi:MAG TPA: hypothetical protein VGJ15_11515, partial [Pirellulales bacterium]